MKEYEIFSDLRVPVNSKIIVRLDGRSFHSFAKKMELVKPYDDAFYNVMVNVSKELFEEFSPLFIYTFSALPRCCAPRTRRLRSPVCFCPPPPSQGAFPPTRSTAHFARCRDSASPASLP